MAKIKIKQDGHIIETDWNLTLQIFDVLHHTESYANILCMWVV